jgi:hypothetical protein
MIVFLLVCVLASNVLTAGVIYVLMLEQRRSNSAMQRIHTAVDNFDARRELAARMAEFDAYMQRPIPMSPVPVDILPRIIHKAMDNYEQWRVAA